MNTDNVEKNLKSSNYMRDLGLENRNTLDKLNEFEAKMEVKNEMQDNL